MSLSTLCKCLIIEPNPFKSKLWVKSSDSVVYLARHCGELPLDFHPWDLGNEVRVWRSELEVDDVSLMREYFQKVIVKHAYAPLLEMRRT